MPLVIMQNWEGYLGGGDCCHISVELLLKGQFKRTITGQFYGQTLIHSGKMRDLYICRFVLS